MPTDWKSKKVVSAAEKAAQEAKQREKLKAAETRKKKHQEKWKTRERKNSKEITVPLEDLALPDESKQPKRRGSKNRRGSKKADLRSRAVSQERTSMRDLCCDTFEAHAVDPDRCKHCRMARALHQGFTEKEQQPQSNKQAVSGLLDGIRSRAVSQERASMNNMKCDDFEPHGIDPDRCKNCRMARAVHEGHEEPAASGHGALLAAISKKGSAASSESGSSGGSSSERKPKWQQRKEEMREAAKQKEAVEAAAEAGTLASGASDPASLERRRSKGKMLAVADADAATADSGGAVAATAEPGRGGFLAAITKKGSVSSLKSAVASPPSDPSSSIRSSTPPPAVETLSFASTPAALGGGSSQSQVSAAAAVQVVEGVIGGPMQLEARIALGASLLVDSSLTEGEEQVSV
jgi:hypothetical protein